MLSKAQPDKCAWDISLFLFPWVTAAPCAGMCEWPSQSGPQKDPPNWETLPEMLRSIFPAHAAASLASPALIPLDPLTLTLSHCLWNLAVAGLGSRVTAEAWFSSAVQLGQPAQPFKSGCSSQPFDSGCSAQPFSPAVQVGPATFSFSSHL